MATYPDQALMQDYCTAFFDAHAVEPIIEPNGRNGYRIVNHSGSFDGYFAKDVANLIRGLRKLAKA